MKEIPLELFDLTSLDQMPLHDIARSLDYQTLYILHQAYICKLYLDRYDGELVERVVDLSDYIYCKSEDNRSQVSIADAIFMLMDTGKTIDELENMEKWEIMASIDSVSCY